MDILDKEIYLDDYEETTREDLSFFPTKDRYSTKNSEILPIDCRKETAKSIAESLLARALPRCKVIGAFEASSSEVLVKVKQAELNKTKALQAYVDIEFDTKKVITWKDEPLSYEEFKDLKWSNKHFYGIKTSIGTTSTITQRELGPALAKPIKSAAVLHSLNIMAGGKHNDVGDLFEAMYGVEMPDPAMVAPILSEGYEPRAMASINKRHHTVFGHYNEEGIINVHMDTYTRKTFGEYSTADWGRFVVAGRYIGIANAFYDPVLGKLLLENNMRLSFAPPKHSVNNIPPRTLQLPPIDLKCIKATNTFEKSLLDSYEKINSEDMLAIISEHLESSKLSLEQMTNYSDEYVKSAKKLMAEARLLGRQKYIFRPNSKGTVELIPYAPEPIVYEEKVEIARKAEGISPFGACVIAMSHHITRLEKKCPGKRNSIYADCLDIKDLAYLTGFKKGEARKKLHRVWKDNRPHDFVHRAINEMKLVQPNTDLAIRSVTRFLSSITNCGLNVMSLDCIKALDNAANEGDERLLNILLEAAKGNITHLNRAKERIVQPSENIYKAAKGLANTVENFFVSHTVQWAKRYKAQSTKFLKRRKEMLANKDMGEIEKRDSFWLLEEALRYQQLSEFFYWVDLSVIEDGHLENEVILKNTYFYKSFVNFVRKRKIKVAYNAAEIFQTHRAAARHLDELLEEYLDVSFEELLDKVEEKLCWLHDDLDYILKEGKTSADIINRDITELDVYLATRVKEEQEVEDLLKSYDNKVFLNREGGEILLVDNEELEADRSQESGSEEEEEYDFGEIDKLMSSYSTGTMIGGGFIASTSDNHNTLPVGFITMINSSWENESELALAIEHAGFKDLYDFTNELKYDAHRDAFFRRYPDFLVKMASKNIANEGADRSVHETPELI